MTLGNGPNGGEWAWTVTAPGLAAHVIRDTRGKVVATELLGEEPTGVTVCDRYAGYKFIGLDRKQVCLAHIRRDFIRMSEGEKEFRPLGARLLGLLDEVFWLWHMFQRDEIERNELRRWSRHARKRLLALLHEGATARGYDTPGRCRGLLESEPAMWTFVDVDGVPPTNNDAERAIRPVVLARKVSLGSRSDRGSRFVERMQTVSGTLTRQGRRMHESCSELPQLRSGARTLRRSSSALDRVRAGSRHRQTGFTMASGGIQARERVR